MLALVRAVLCAPEQLPNANQKKVFGCTRSLRGKGRKIYRKRAYIYRNFFGMTHRTCSDFFVRKILFFFCKNGAHSPPVLFTPAKPELTRPFLSGVLFCSLSFPPLLSVRTVCELFYMKILVRVWWCLSKQGVALETAVASATRRVIARKFIPDFISESRLHSV